MAKITIVGDAVVVTSALKLEDIETIAKYRPDALTLMGGKDDKEPVFKVGVGDVANLTKYGATFSGETHDDQRLATITILCLPKYDDIDMKEAVADALGAGLVQLNKLEATLPEVLREIEAEKAEVMSHISMM